METITQYAQTYRVFFRLIPIVIATLLWYSIAYKMVPILKDGAFNENLERMKKSFGNSAGKTMFFFFKGVVPFAFGAALYASLLYIKDPVLFTKNVVKQVQAQKVTMNKKEALKPLSINFDYILLGLVILGITLSPFIVREQLSSKWEVNILKDLLDFQGKNTPHMLTRYRSNLRTLYGSSRQYYHRFHLLRAMYYLINNKNMDARNALFEVIDCCEQHPEYKYAAKNYLIAILIHSDQQDQATEIKNSLVDESTLDLKVVEPYLKQGQLQFDICKEVA